MTPVPFNSLVDNVTFHDRLGRTVLTIQAFVDGTPSAGDDLTTAYTYNGIGQTLTLTAVLPDSTYQTTEYVYGVTTGGGSDINSNDLLATVKYPDKTTGEPSESADNQESFQYNALGQTKQKIDRNQTAHDFIFDLIGRSTDDIVTVLGAGVDGAIRRIGQNYDTAGRIFQITSYSDAAGTSLVNQVERHYNGLGQLAAEYQEHTGAVDTETTPAVFYAYSEMEGGANHSRLIGMTYPDGRVVRYEYSAGLDDDISRLSFLADDNSGSVGTHLEEFAYLGLSTVVARLHPESGVDLTYVKQGSEPDGDAGDQYTGLDRFGRIVDQRWINSTDDDVDRFSYGHDRNGNRLYRENLIDAAFSELYHDGTGYDLLDRLTAFNRGELNGSKDEIATPTRSQQWVLDALGNWNLLTNDGGSPEAREHNAQNQLVDVNGNPLTFDNNGNTTTDEQGRKLKYDAWNRLARVLTPGEDPIAEYAYDGLHHRVLEDSGTPRALYYSSNWQVVEERESGIAVVQNVWSPVYVDALILRDRNANATGGDGPNSSGLEERIYALHDANFNVTGLVNTSAVVVERFVYDPYGAVTVLDDDFSPDGNNASDVSWQYLYQGGRLNLASLLYNFRNREYSATLGRWLQQDPMRYIDGLNLYLSLGSDPINAIDPSGTDWLDSVTSFGFYKLLYAGDWNMNENEYRQCVAASVPYTNCYVKCVADTYSTVASALIIATGGSVDASMELPWQEKLQKGFGSKESVQSLGNTIFQKLKDHNNPIVRRFAQWARTAGTGTRIPGIRHPNPAVMRSAKVLRTGGRALRGGAAAAALVGIYAAITCSKQCGGW